MRLVDDGRALDAISDAVDEGMFAEPVRDTVPSHASLTVNKLKGKGQKWDDASKFDADKDKQGFRQYEEACDRVKNFYREQHGMFIPVTDFPAVHP